MLDTTASQSTFDSPSCALPSISRANYLSLTISFDHDIVDEAPAARFMQRLKELIESGYALSEAAVKPEQPE